MGSAIQRKIEAPVPETQCTRSPLPGTGRSNSAVERAIQHHTTQVKTEMGELAQHIHDGVDLILVLDHALDLRGQQIDQHGHAVVRRQRPQQYGGGLEHQALAKAEVAPRRECDGVSGLFHVSASFCAAHVMSVSRLSSSSLS